MQATRCKCGNEQGKPRVSPYPVQFTDVRTKSVQVIMYNGGMRPFNDGVQCWFCSFTARAT